MTSSTYPCFLSVALASPITFWGVICPVASSLAFNYILCCVSLLILFRNTQACTPWHYLWFHIVWILFLLVMPSCCQFVFFLDSPATEMPGEKKIFQEGSCSEMPQDAAPSFSHWNSGDLTRKSGDFNRQPENFIKNLSLRIGVQHSSANGNSMHKMRMSDRKGIYFD